MRLRIRLLFSRWVNYPILHVTRVTDLCCATTRRATRVTFLFQTLLHSLQSQVSPWRDPCSSRSISTETTPIALCVTSAEVLAQDQEQYLLRHLNTSATSAWVEPSHACNFRFFGSAESRSSTRQGISRVVLRRDSLCRDAHSGTTH